MPRPILYVAITSHGFGHATRTSSIVETIRQLDPDILAVMVTTSPHWLLASYLSGEFIVRPRSFDVGAIQSDSLTIDRAATLAQWQNLHQRHDALVASEVTFIRQMSVKDGRVGLVLADLPPLAMDIAAGADIPCWGIGNFGWDFIYRDWGDGFTAIADRIAGQFSRCDRLFRLPFHEPMSAFPTIQDVGLTGGTPHYSTEELRDRLRLPNVERDRTVLLTFGGLGLQSLPYEGLKDFPDWSFITFDRKAPQLPNLCIVPEPDDPEAVYPPYRPVDLMPLCGRIVSKPGYSTFAEACRQQVPIATTTRQGFAEATCLIEGIQAQLPHQVLDAQRLLAGDWSFLKEPLSSPKSDPEAKPLTTDGNETIARAIVEQLHGV